MDEAQLGDETREHLGLATSNINVNATDAISNATVEIKSYEAFFPFLQDLSATATGDGVRHV